MRKQPQLKELLNVLGEHIRARRKALGLTQEVLAEKAGLSTNYIARLELGSNTPSLPALICLARALGVPVSDLLSVDTEHKWYADALEIARALEPMDEVEAEFVLGQLRALTAFVRSVKND